MLSLAVVGAFLVVGLWYIRPKKKKPKPKHPGVAACEALGIVPENCRRLTVTFDVDQTTALAELTVRDEAGQAVGSALGRFLLMPDTSPRLKVFNDLPED